MSIERLFKAAASAASPTTAFACVHYTPLPSSMRCKDYQDGGTCARPDSFLCDEWERRNRHRLPQIPKSMAATLSVASSDNGGCDKPSKDEASIVQQSGPAAHEGQRLTVGASHRSLDHDLFGNPIPVFAESPKASRSPDLSAHAPAPQRAQHAAPGSEAVPAIESNRQRGWTTDDIDSFKALGAEVLLESDAYGEVWLVPAYTNKDRREITLEHPGVLACVMSILPGSRITAFNRKKPEGAP